MEFPTVMIRIKSQGKSIEGSSDATMLDTSSPPSRFPFFGILRVINPQQQDEKNRLYFFYCAEIRFASRFYP